MGRKGGGGRKAATVENCPPNAETSKEFFFSKDILFHNTGGAIASDHAETPMKYPLNPTTSYLRDNVAVLQGNDSAGHSLAGGQEVGGHAGLRGAGQRVQEVSAGGRPGAARGEKTQKSGK